MHDLQMDLTLSKEKHRTCVKEVSALVLFGMARKNKRV